ncbi:ATP-binding protein [Bradyrhizobium sp. UFLA05-153]
MSKESKARIFDPFFSTKPSGMGMGRGLAISRTIIENPGGDLRLTESNAHESTFEMTLAVSSRRLGPRELGTVAS